MLHMQHWEHTRRVGGSRRDSTRQARGARRSRAVSASLLVRKEKRVSSFWEMEVTYIFRFLPPSTINILDMILKTSMWRLNVRKENAVCLGSWELRNDTVGRALTFLLASHAKPGAAADDLDASKGMDKITPRQKPALSRQRPEVSGKPETI